MTYRIITVCVIAVLLLSFTVTYASRPEPPFDDVTPMDNLYWEICEGAGEEECLTRRTLTAQIDYIYTQKQKP
ncbi:phytosulfokine [Salix suchowensis]|nr:phytosulfokine [Salix suchowensis]